MKLKEFNEMALASLAWLLFIIVINGIYFYGLKLGIW